VSADPKLKRLNAWVHREYMRLFARCFAEYWPQWDTGTPELRDQVLRSVVICMNGITASAVTSPRDWPAQRQIEHLELQLKLLRRWAAPNRDEASAPATSATRASATAASATGASSARGARA
jgi:hypothetical protein